MRAVLLSVLLVAASSMLTATSIFNFDSDTVGKSTTFTDTNNAISATFSSDGPTGEYYVTPGFFYSLTGNVLLDPGPLVATNTTPYSLTVTFNQNLSSIFLDFAVRAPLPTPFVLTAYLNATQVGSITATDSFPSDPTYNSPEGTASFNSVAFNRVVLSSTAIDMAVDNITVNPVASTPEPAGVSLAALGLCSFAIGFIRAKRKVRLNEKFF